MSDEMHEEEGERRYHHRALTNDDVKKIVDCLEDRIEQRFYINLGKGVWSFVWRAAVAVLLTLAAYGHFKGP